MCTQCTPGTAQACGDAATCNAGGTQQCDSMGNWGACSLPTQPCVALPPGGWIPYAVAGTGGCPGGFATPVDYVSAASALPDTCSCSCSGTQTCTATAQFTQYGNASCSGSGTPLGIQTVNPACGGSTLGNITSGQYYMVSNPQASAVPACQAAPTIGSSPAVMKTDETLCGAQLTCPSGVCLTSAQQGSLCVAQSGDVACPTGFNTKTLVSQGVSDTRGCGPCSCGSTLACTLTSVLIDNDSTCATNNGYNFTVSAPGCGAAPSTFPDNALMGNFTTTGSGACNTVTNASQPNGGVGLDPTSEMTVCCP